MVLLSWWISATLFQISLCRVLHCPQKLKSIKQNTFSHEMIDMSYPWTHHEDDLHRIFLQASSFMICARVPFDAILHDFQILQHQYANWSIDGNGYHDPTLSSTDLSTTYWMRHLWFKHLCLPWQPRCQAQRALSFCEGAQRLELTSVTAATPAPWDDQRIGMTWDDMGPGLGYKPGGIVKIKLLLLKKSPKKGGCSMAERRVFTHPVSAVKICKGRHLVIDVYIVDVFLILRTFQDAILTGQAGLVGVHLSVWIKHPFWTCSFSFDDSKRLLYMKIYSWFTQHPVLNGNDEMVVSGCSCIFQWKK